MSSLRFLFASGLLVLAGPVLFADILTWNVSSGNWTNPSNWSPNGTPGSSTGVVLNSSSDTLVNSNVGSVNSISHDGTATASLDIQSGGSLTVGTISSQTPANFFATALTIGVYSTGNLDTNVGLTVGQLTAPNDQAYVESFGRLVLEGSSNPSTPVNHTLGALITGGGAIVDVGDFSVPQSANLTLTSLYMSQGNDPNGSYLRVNGGTLTVGGTSPGDFIQQGTTGTLWLRNNATVNIVGGYQTPAFAGTIMGYGTLNLQSGIFIDGGTISAGSATNPGGLTVVNQTGSQLQLGSGTLQSSGGGNPLTLQGSFYFNGSRLNNDGGGITLAGADAISNGTISGPLTLAGGTVLTIEGGVNATGSDIHLVTDNNGSAQVVLAADAYIDGAFFQLDAGTTVDASAAHASLQNSVIEGPGTWEATNGFTVDSGTTQMDGNLDAGGSGVSVTDGAELEGSGTISGNVTVGDGTIKGGDSPGTMTIVGNLNLTSTTNFLVQIGGLTAGSQFDVINVSGTADLAGALNVALLNLGNGYVPTIGDTFQFLTCADGCDGTFSSVSNPDFTIEYSADSVSLEITGGPPSLPPPSSAAPEPGTLTMLAAGFTVVISAKRRKLKP